MPSANQYPIQQTAVPMISPLILQAIIFPKMIFPSEKKDHETHEVTPEYCFTNNKQK